MQKKGKEINKQNKNTSETPVRGTKSGQEERSRPWLKAIRFYWFLQNHTEPRALAVISVVLWSC